MDDKGIIIDNYVEKYFYIVFDEIKLNGNKIANDSFIIKSFINDDKVYLTSFIKEVNLIFGDSDKDETHYVSKLVMDWYSINTNLIASEANKKIKYMEDYFKDNVVMVLGPRNWETKLKKNGRPFLLKYALDDIDELNVSWINSKIVRHFYEQWYDDEVLICSEKLMNFD